MFLSRIIFRVLRIIQIQGIDFTYQESFNTCFISLLGYRIGFFGYVQLLCLIIEMLHQQKNVLIEVYLFLTNFESTTSPVALGYRTFPRRFPQSRIGILTPT